MFVTPITWAVQQISSPCFDWNNKLEGVIMKIKQMILSFLIFAVIIFIGCDESDNLSDKLIQNDPPAIDGFEWIRAGHFTMGNAMDFNANPPHTVTLSKGFYMGKYPVTVGEFKSFVNDTGYQTEAETGSGGNVCIGGSWQRKTDANWENPYFSQTDDHPVVLATWNDAVYYCNWLSEKEELTPVYTIGTPLICNWNANGYRLPTEAEWEYACRAGTVTAYSTGASISTGQANYNNAVGSTTKVGSYASNPWGLYDMHGNMFEWCWDWFGAYSAGSQTDPKGAVSGVVRVIRGGSWDHIVQAASSAFRNGDDPFAKDSNSALGFRVVRPE